jgi:hypothetical protein
MGSATLLSQDCSRQVGRCVTRRRDFTLYIPTTLALVFSFAGYVLLFVTGWLGGELVDRLGVGVDDGANLDAPNSLTHKRATPT